MWSQGGEWPYRVGNAYIEMFLKATWCPPHLEPSTAAAKALTFTLVVQGRDLGAEAP